jgi:4-amino-4-deoxy-L-arabinose transferase-like glycosyltransferase
MMAESANHPRAVERSAAWWTLILAVALGLRVVAAALVTWYVRRLGKGKLCVFADTGIYCDLAKAIVEGTPYVVMQWGIPHYALRTPGYPLFLAACWKVFGENLLAVRLVQAVLGVVAVWLVAKLAKAVAPGDQASKGPVALAAAGLAAVHPYLVGLSALVLSEATFLPLMMAGLWGLALLWRKPDEPGLKRPWLAAIGTGLAMGAAILSRPSWALFVPAILAVWVLGAGRGMRRKALGRAVLVSLATASILAPWWVRNERVIGRFVPTALWVGASLYDGIGPQANGSSDMEFINEPDVRGLGESEQDSVFRDRSIAFAKGNPGRVLELALIKFGRFWSPWPNADTLQAPGAAVASAAVTLPIFALIALGVWDRRRDLRALALLAGPLAYFCVLHMVFVSSIRYRIPGELPAMVLASLGLSRIVSWARPAVSNGPPSDPGGHPSTSIRRRFRKLLGWAVVLILAVVVGGSIAAYYYVIDSDTLADLVRREAPKYLPGCRVDVSKVRVKPFMGEVTLTTLLVRELEGESPGPMIASSPRVQVRFDPWAMIKGRFEAREVTVVKPTIRLRRKPDGSWNVEGLLADPWPSTTSGALPPIAIQEGTVELFEEGAKAPLGLLRDVSIKVPASTGGSSPILFELTAKGEAGLFDRFHVEGSIDPTSGRVSLKDGELVHLTLSDALRHHLPIEARERLALAGLAGGEIDADLSSLSFDPEATPRLHYQATARLRRGVWKCSKMPVPISDLSVDLAAKDGVLEIIQAEGSDGSTSLSVRGKVTINPENPTRSPFEIHADVSNLEVDNRIRRWIPAETRELWDAYFPQIKADPDISVGRINVSTVVSRAKPEAELDFTADVTCLDVAMRYKHFPYTVDHVQGRIRLKPGTMTLNVHSIVGNKTITVIGDVKDPGPDAVAKLDFIIESMPVDQTLFDALPPEVKKTVERFKPAGTVAARAKLVRYPPLNKGDDPRGRVKFDAWIDLNPGCSMIWEGLKYPVLNLTGKLEIHPGHWIFEEMKGSNGQAIIQARGDVEELKRGSYKVDVRLKAENLPFDDQLRNALPRPWQVTWATLNPTGASDIDAHILVDPAKPEHDRIVINPRKQTGVKLRFNPLVGEGVASTPIELRMDDVTGTFVYDTADSPHTSMSNVQFSFQRAPVTFASGTVDVKDNGQFNLGVSHLKVEGLRLDEELRRYMPPVMAQFSRKLDDRKIASIKADLGLGWSGKAGESAWCKWDDALVVLYNNKVSIGTDLNLDHIEGQIDSVRGSFYNGRELDVHGKLKLDSVSVFGQQITAMTANLDVDHNFARLDQIKAKVLGGVLSGHVRATLDATPLYSVRLDLQKADLKEYAMNQPGHQTFRGLVNAQVDLSGVGYDPYAITGSGMAQIAQADLGTLPIALRFVNVLKPARDARKEAKTAFDSADLAFAVKDGHTTLDPVRLVGNAISLDGKGSVDVRGEVALKLKILPGRDERHVPLLSDLAREFFGQIVVVRVQGSVAAPTFNLEYIPGPGAVATSFKRNQDMNKTGLVGPLKTGLEPRFRAGLRARWFGQDEAQ